MTRLPPELPIEEPLSELERQLISEFLAKAGADYHTLLVRNDDEARSLLRQAAQFASVRLSEIEARADYIHLLHDSPDRER
jgi:hypothetical protein